MGECPTISSPSSWTQHGTLRLIDQTRLPAEEVYVECGTVEAVAHAIRTMQVRGAPAIGIAAAMGLAMGARAFQASAFPVFYAALEAMAAQLTRTRPTAVNLAWAVRRIVRRGAGAPRVADGRDRGAPDGRGDGHA